MINKKKLIKKFILYILCIVAVIFFWNCSIYLIQNLKSDFDSVSIRYADSKFTKQSIKDACKNEPDEESEKKPLITAWIENNNREVKNKSTDTITTVNLIELYGDMPLVISEDISIGNFVSLSDYSGCILDESTAYDLFGCIDPVGNSVYINNNNYMIRGIVKTKVHFAAVQIEDNQHEFNNMELVFSDKENGKSLAESFISRSNLPKGYLISDHSFTILLLSDLYLLPSWLIIFIISIKMFKSIKSINDVFQKNTALIIFIFITVILIFAVNFRIHMYDQLIPNKWSDLNFWVDKFNEIKTNFYNNYYHSQVPRDMIYNKSLMLYIISTILSCISIILIKDETINFIVKLKINRESILNTTLFCFMLNNLIALAMLLIFKMLEADINVPYCYWYIISLYTLVIIYNNNNLLSQPAPKFKLN